MPTPFVVAATDYLEAGWAPIPLPVKGKWPPPDGYTGANGKYADAEDVRKWCAPKARYKAGNLNSAPGNVALRLPANVLGIDVDAYGEKSGADTLAEAESEWGCLPATWVATSRTDGLSGIRLFRIPEGLAWPGQVGPGIELIRWDHRYVVSAPSVHDKTGKVYGWFRQVRVAEGDDDSTGYELVPVEPIPEMDDLAELPAQWVEGLTEGREWSARAVNESMDATAVNEWLESRPDPNDICAEMRRTVTRYSRDIRTAGDDGGAHDVARDGAWAVLGDSKQGHGGVRKALAELRGVFLEAVKRRRGRDDGDGERLAKEEWTRAVVRGVQKVSAEGGGTDLDPCASLVDAADLKGGDGTGSRYMNWRLDDIGNAERWIRVANDRARWSEALGGWLLWDETRWAPDDTRQVERWAVKAVDKMEEELDRLEASAAGGGETDAQESQRKAFKAHKKSSGSAGKLKSMVEVARGRKGIVVPSKDFDQHPDLLNTPNGTVILGDNGLDFRDSHRREDYLTMITGVPYEKGARSVVWEEQFLDVVLPDPEERAWAQTLVGYSLYGGNPERVIVIAKGPTTSGKTTFAEVVANALGDYASPYNLSLLKEKMEEGGRADVIDVLNRRFIVASEASAAWNLHADRIKLVTGGEKLSARRLNSNEYIKRVPEFTPWITTNSIPQIPGADQALWRRLKLASFPVSIEEDKIDVTLRRRLMTQEAQRAILAWCLDGWERYVRVGLKDAPVAVISATMEARDEMNEAGQFVRDCGEEGSHDDYVVLAAQLFAAYQMWAEENGDQRNRYNKVAFGRAMNARGLVAGRKYLDGKQQRVWFGIRLKPEWAKVA